MRLNKFIADCGVSSRRKAEEFIISGRISVDKKIVTDLSKKVDPQKDEVSLDGEKLYLKKHLYILLNKPKGVVTTTDDEKNRKTVIDLLKTKERIYPVGRLDYNTTGVLILTNDGDFKNLLTHPKSKVPREYEVKLNKDLTEEDKETLLKGVYIDNKKGKFTKVKLFKSKKFVIIECVEGRNHFVKNMFGALGYYVESLNRNSYAGIKIDIPIGSYRNLTADEIKQIIKYYGN
ncbi:MAG: pseudouridine synthase [Ignavibacteriaceae bacterium]